MPISVLKKAGLPELNLAIRVIHFPKKLTDAEAAKKRFAFEDLFLLQINNLQTKSRLAREKASPIKIEKRFLESVIKKLPFTLTFSQQQSLKEILNDLQKQNPMSRLLQGDVGSGKTVIAAIAALIVSQNQGQSALMVPTEVLAKQHYKTIIKLFGYLSVPTGILTNSQCRCFYGEELETEVKKPDFYKKIACGNLKIIIGTHALIASAKRGRLEQKVSFENLAFVAIDEQHRFGVEQRASLLRNSGSETNVNFVMPHFLSMSATPIPRTLSLTLFGDLDLSTITELPVGRKAIITKIVAPANRDKAYQFVREQIQKGRQAFIICPRIEVGKENTSISHLPYLTSHSWADVKAVKEEYEKLSTKIFPDLKIAMLHGKLKAKEKNQIMNDFTENKVNILVATSVVEVGVDIPNASIMIIEGADRFGLAQLYQFRGRVGRASHQSFCLLFTDSISTSTHQRLKSLLEAKNGFELAEKDLAIRGPGEFIGHTQTGMPDLLMRSLNNMELIKEARLAAVEILKKEQGLESYPLLKAELGKFKQRIHLE
jgi:ATP-dependent DNA helicase RecG